MKGYASASFAKVDNVAYSGPLGTEPKTERLGGGRDSRKGSHQE